MTVFIFPAGQGSPLGAQLWAVAEACWLCWGQGCEGRERRQTVCLDLAGEGKQNLGRREKWGEGNPG